MQSARNQTYSELTTEEISKSIYYIRLNESYNIFQQSINLDIKFINYHTFLNELNNFISNEQNKNILKCNLQPMIQSAIQFSARSEFNQDNSILLFNILDKILQNQIDFSFSDFTGYFFSLTASQDSIQILKRNEKTLEKVFSDEKFFSFFIDQQKINSFFEKAFIDFISLDLCYLFRHLVCEIAPFSLRRKINLSKILAFLLAQIKEEIQVEYSIVLSKLVAVNTANRLFLNNNQSFFLFSNAIQSASSEIVIECFNNLVFIEPINLELFTNIILFYQKYQQHQKSIFHWIFNDVINFHFDMLSEINQTVPFFGWITLKTSVNDVMDAITNLSKFSVSFISSFISPLFSLLNKNDSKFEEYQFTIQLIEKQILLHKISLTDLLNFHFLETFIINVKIDILGQLFEKIYTFSQLAYDVFTLPKSESLRSDVIDKLIQMAGKFPNNASFISIFLVVSNSRKNISDLMETIIENKNGDLCVALGDSFVKSDSVVHYFIDKKGIEWLDKIFKKKIIDLQQFVYLINSLTKNFYISEVDKYIDSLPENHPIFSICQEDLMMLSYGSQKSHFYPLKITSFFHLMKFPQTIDPYNAYMIGKHVLKKLLNVDDLPILSEIVNRYVDDECFKKLIEMDPSKFDSFCDTQFDHFPLFQVNEFYENNVFNIKFKAISFWFKFGDTFMQNLKVPFFLSEKLQLFVKNKQLLANYDGTEYDVPINPLKWNNIIIIVCPQKMTHYIEVYVNLNKAVFTSTHELNDLSCFEFSTYSTFLFIGPSIRIYQNELMINDIEKIYNNGVPFLGHLNESKIITPFSKEYLKLKKNVFAVKYNGFPVHFLTKKNMDLVFNRITNSNLKPIDFVPMISACFKVYSILHNHLHDFLPWIFLIYSKVPQFINSNYMVKTLKFFSKHMKKDEIINTIIGSEHLWSSISNDIIIYSLLKIFDNLKFYKEKKKLEIFLTIKLYYIEDKNTSNLIEFVFHSSKKIQSIILDLFLGSYFISKTQEKFTQCNLIGNSKSQQSDSNSEISIDQNNVSIQCNLLKNQKNTFLENIDSICLFQKISITSFQKVFIQFLKDFVVTREILIYIPFDDIYSIFITSSIEVKSILYPILLIFEKNVPNSIQFNSTFFFQVFLLFNYKNVWTSSFNFLTENSIAISRQSLLPVLFSLIWSYTVSSIHSIASTGHQLHDENDEIFVEIKKILKFLSNENNLKIVSNDKNTQKLISSLFPFLIGIKQNHEFLSSSGIIESQNKKLNDLNFSAPSPFCFIAIIWNDVIKESSLPFKTNEENYNNLQSFIIRSPIFNFYFKYLFSLSDSNFIEILGSFFSIPFNSGNKELSNCFIQYFVHSLLNVIAENYSYTSKVNLVFQFIHFLNISGIIEEKFLPIFVSDLFLILSVMITYDEHTFDKLSHQFNLLLLNLFVSILNSCHKNPEKCQNMIDNLYRAINKQIHILTKIAIESNSIKYLYFKFFKQSSQFCSNQQICNKVIDEFCKMMKINNDFDSNKNDKIEMNEWNEFVETNIIPLLSKIKINQISVSIINEYSKSYTSSFLNALDKQQQISQKLVPLFEEAKKFQESKACLTKTYYNFSRSSTKFTDIV